MRRDAVAIGSERSCLISHPQRRFGLDKLQLRISHQRNLRLVGKEVTAGKTDSSRARIAKEVVWRLLRGERTKSDNIRIEPAEAPVRRRRQHARHPWIRSST